MPTYLEQREKIIQAYYNEKLDPYNCKACFVGNLFNGNPLWFTTKTYDYDGKLQVHNTELERQWHRKGIALLSENNYTPDEITRLEDNFLIVLNRQTINAPSIGAERSAQRERHPNYEEALFKAMDSTLDILQQIHESKGEVVNRPEFKKRSLQPA